MQKAMNRIPQENQNRPNAAQPALPSQHGAGPVSSTPLIWLTVLSLDAPAVAVLWQLLFVRSFNVQISSIVTLLLALVVWLIYVADRELDVLDTPREGTEATRHVFYRKHLWAFLLPFCVVFLVAAWISLTRLDTRTFRDGMVILAAVSVYFLAVHVVAPKREWLPKEMLVGVLFGVGTCFPVWEHMTQHVALLLAPYLLFTLLCWMNCAAIEFEEWKRLRGYQFGAPHPWTLWMGRHFILIAAVIAAIAVGLVGTGFDRPRWPLLMSIAVSALALVWIRWKDHAISIDQFRLLVDIALFTPVVFLLVS